MKRASDVDENLDTDEFQSHVDKSFNQFGQNYNSIDKRGGKPQESNELRLFPKNENDLDQVQANLIL